MTRFHLLLFSPFFLITSCAPNLSLPETARLLGKKAAIQLDVPFFPQPSGQCGPGALASVLNYWNAKTTPEEIAKKVDLPRLKGALPFDLTHYARSKGFRASSFKGNIRDLQEKLGRGRPLVAFLNLGTTFFPVGHFLVVTGIDPEKKLIIVHSGMRQNKAVSYDRFITAWKGGGYWTLEVTPPDAG